MDSDLERAKVEFETECRRVGVRMDELFDPEDARPRPGVPGGMAAAGVALAKALPILRSLPDHAGTAAFLDALADDLTRFSGRRME